MKCNYFKILLALNLLIQSPLEASPRQELSLKEAYAAALQQSEHTDYTKSLSLQSKASYQQAQSYLFPSLSAEGVYLDTRYKARGVGTETQTQRKTVGLQLRQTLFQGGLFSALQKEKINQKKTNLLIEKENLNIYQMVVENFYKISLYENTLSVLKEIEKTSQKRVVELQKRVRIGKSKQTDLLTNELQNQSLKIEIGHLEALIFSEREVFSRLTGYSQDSSFKVDSQLPNIQSLNFYLNKIPKSTDIEIQNKNYEMAEKTESISSAQHLPQLYLDLEANYGELSSTQEGREYVGRLTLEIPLFEGGRTRAAAAESHWKKIEERSRRDQLIKDVELDIKKIHADLLKNKELFSVYEKSLETAKKNFEIHNKELRLGLVSNIELLNSLSTYLESKKNREEAFYQLKLAEVKLAQILGKTIEDLK